MSTILDALKKLERDKHVDEAHARPPDPLAPAPEPALSPEDVTGRNMGWMAAGVALTFVIGIGIGVATFSDGGEDASIEAAGVLATPPAVAAPARRGRPDTLRPAPVAGTEATAPLRSPLSEGRIQSPRMENTFLPTPTPTPTPTSTPTRMRTASAAAVASPPAASSASRSVAHAPDPWEQAAVAQASEASEEEGRETPETEVKAAASGAASPSVSAGVPVASLPEIELPPEPAAPAAPKPEPAALTPVAPTPESSAAPARPALADVVVSDSNDRLEVKVLKTVWHPKPDRRSAQLRLNEQGEAIEVRESQMVEGYRVESITPSTVVLSKGGVTVTHRVGR